MRAEIVQRLLVFYLKAKQESAYQEALLGAVRHLKIFESALEYIEKHYASYLPLVAISSEDQHTAQQYIKEKEQLLKLLEASLEYNEEDNQFVKFNPKNVSQAWQQLRINTSETDLTRLHAGSSNLGINEKFLTGQLRSQEWLTDLDLDRLLNAVGLNKKAIVTRLDADEIGSALHFQRVNNLNATKPYKIPFLLTKGNMGNINSQGSHWVFAEIEVIPIVPDAKTVPDKKDKKFTIKVKLIDSVAMGADEKNKLKQIFSEAIHYQHISRTPTSTKVYQAFPDAIVESEMLTQPKEAKEEKQNNNSWDCGYCAFKNLLINMDEADIPVENRPAFNAIKASQGSDALQKSVYRLMLSAMPVPESMSLPATIQIDRVSGKPGRIQEAYLSHYLAHLAAVRPRSEVSPLPQAALEEEAKLQAEIQNQTKLLKAKFVLCLSTEEEKTEQEKKGEAVKKVAVFSVDMGTLFEEKDPKPVIKAKIQALVNYLIENQVQSLKISNMDQMPEHDFFIDRCESVTACRKIEIDGQSKKLKKAFQELAGRNQLIHDLQLNLDSEERIWPQIWQHRFSNLGLFHDPNAISTGMLPVFSRIRRYRYIDKAIADCPEQYFIELLAFIHEHQKFFERKSAGFPFKTLGILDALADRSIQNKRVGEAYLKLLVSHFQAGRYFPFEKLDLHFTVLSDAGFDALLELLTFSEKYPSLKAINLHNEALVPEGDKKENQRFSAQQYERLIKLCKDKKICIDLRINERDLSEYSPDPDFKDPLILAEFDLMNVIAVNQRQRNIERRKGLVPSGPVLPVIEEDIAIEEPFVKGNIRACKLRNFDYKSNISFDVSIDQQAEQQHQQQSQLQQEMQQETQMQEQQQNDIEINDDQAGYHLNLVSREQYCAEEKEYAAALRAGVTNQCPRVISGNIDELPDRFWRFAISQQGLPNSIQCVTDNAAAKINALPQAFWGSLNMDNLSSGFYAFRDPAVGLVLHYDETKYVENKNESLLTVKLATRLRWKNWLGDLRQVIPEAELSSNIRRFGGLVQSKDGPRIETATLSVLTTFMHHLNPALAQKIRQDHQWCFSDMPADALDTSDKNIQFNDPREYFALIDLLIREGCEGLQYFLTVLKTLQSKDKDLYISFKNCFIKGGDENCVTVEGLMSEKSFNIIDKLADMTPSQKAWWKDLTAAHVDAVGYADLEPLYEGFMDFLAKFPKNLTLPIPCPIQRTGNMLASLDFLLAILGKVSPRNLRDQLIHLDSLDFSNEGAWYAARWNGFHFFHAEMRLSPDTLAALTEDKKTYRVNYAELKGLAKETSLDEAIVLFHRFLGCSEKIAEPYEQYVQLTDYLKSDESKDIPDEVKVRLLPLLALATTGHRGSKGFDRIEFQQFIEFAHINLSFNTLLDSLANVLDQFIELPNLTELKALMKVLLNHDDPISALNEIKDDISESFLKALSIWDKNQNGFEGYYFLQLYGKFKIFDPDHLGDLLKIAALLKKPYDSDQADALIRCLSNFKGKPNYETILKVLSSIDLSNTDPVDLPDLSKIINAFARVSPTTPIPAVFSAISLNLPGCYFNRASMDGMPSLDFDVVLLEKIEAFNQQLAKFGIEEWKVEELKGEGAGQYIQQQYKTLLDVEIPSKVSVIKEMTGVPAFTPDAFVIMGAKVELKKLVIGWLEGICLQGISRAMVELPELKLLEDCCFVRPGLTGHVETMAEEVAALQKYADEVGDLYEKLVQCRRDWGSEFKIDFLLNSPRTNQFTLRELNAILKSIRELELDYIPTDLLESIWSAEAFPSDAPVSDVAANIIEITNLDSFSINQKARVIKQASQIPDVSALKNAIIHAQGTHPSVQDAVLNLFLTQLESDANKDTLILGITRKLLELITEKNDPIITILYKRLSHHLNYYQTLLDELGNINGDDNKRKFLKIISFSYLEKNFNPESFNIAFIQQLVNFANTRSNDFNELMKLFDHRPYPKIEKLQQCFSLTTSEAVIEFVKNYEFDPSGARARPGVLDAQFDISKAIDCIDNILDLARNKPLFYTHKKRLLDQFLYVNAVGRTHSLVMPGFEQSGEYNEYAGKSVMHLTRKQIHRLVKHYRDIISGHTDITVSQQQRQLAKLELLALTREAAYRTTDDHMFAYSTQVISVLAILLYDGVVTGEIRTGEGKSLTTVLEAVLKLARGGAVDVTTDDMELAGSAVEEFGDCYDYLGIDVALIYASTPHEVYQQEGINYSDAAEISLFQEQMALSGKKMPEKVSLIADEEDALALDTTTQFRFATTLEANSDPHFNRNEWVYPLILRFVSQPAFLEKRCPKEIDIQDLREFVLKKCPDVNKAQKSMFLDFMDALLDRWIDSAYTASQMREGEDYVVRVERIIKNEQEISVLCIRVRLNFRENKKSKFSDGVDQFLCVEGNEQIAKGRQFIIYGKRVTGLFFLVEPEKTYLASRSTKNTFDYYLRPEDRNGISRGDITGLTGTAGSREEKEELQKNYGMKFLKIPPHQLLRRVDAGPVIARRKRPWFGAKETAEEALFRCVLEDVQEHMRVPELTPSFLMITKSLAQSQALHDYLANKIPDLVSKGLLQIFNGEQIDRPEREYIKRAGIESMATVTTPLFARGKNFKPKNKKSGLRVYEIGISDERDYYQGIGRGGRNGEYGSSINYISEDEFPNGVPADKDLERVVAEIRLELAMQNSRDRLERQYFADIKDQFFLQYIRLCRETKKQVIGQFNGVRAASGGEVWKKIERHSHFQWEGFLRNIDTYWRDQLNQFRNIVANKPDLAYRQQLLEKVKQLTAHANKAWKKTYTQLTGSTHQTFFSEYVEACKGLGLEPSADVTINLPTYDDETHVVRDELPGIPVMNTPPDFNLSVRPLDPSKINVNAAWLEMANGEAGQRADLKIKALTQELDRIEKIVFNKIIDSKLSNHDRIKHIVLTLLSRHFESYHKDLIAPLHWELLREVTQFVRSYGMEEDKVAMYDAHRDHIQKIQKDYSKSKKLGEYTQYITLAMYNLYDQGAIPDDETLLAYTDLFAASTADAWKSLYTYADELLRSYLSEWGIYLRQLLASSQLVASNDRMPILDELRSRMKDLNESDEKPEIKIKKLLNLLNIASRDALSLDYESDAKISSWSIYSYKNLKGSRFQELLNAIYSKACVFATTMQVGREEKEEEQKEQKGQIETENIMDYSLEFSHIFFLLTVLRRRAILSKVQDNAAIRAVHEDEPLKALFAKMSALQPGDIQSTCQTLRLITERLSYLESKLPDVKLLDLKLPGNNSKVAFCKFFEDVQKRISLFGMSVQHSRYRSEINRPEDELRQSLQDSLQKLTQKNYLHAEHIDAVQYIENKYAKVLADSPDLKALNREHRDLILCALYEVERHIHLQYGSLEHFKFKNKITYQEACLGFSVQFLDSKEKYTLKLTVNHFKENAEWIECQWPEVTKTERGHHRGLGYDPNEAKADNDALLKKATPIDDDLSILDTSGLSLHGTFSPLEEKSKKINKGIERDVNVSSSSLANKTGKTGTGKV